MNRLACLSVICLTLPNACAADEPSNVPPAPDNPPTTSAPQDTAKPEKSAAPAPADAELLRALEKQLAPIDSEHPLVRVGSRMRDVQVRLGKTDAGDETRLIQKEIVDDLDKLIEQAKKGGG